MLRDGARYRKAVDRYWHLQCAKHGASPLSSVFAFIAPNLMREALIPVVEEDTEAQDHAVPAAKSHRE